VSYLLDANAVIAVLNDRSSAPARRLRRHRPNDVAVSAIVAHELYYGAFKSRRKEQNVALVDSLQFEVLDFDKEDARHAGEVRALLASRGLPIGPYDLLIAGQAKARNLVLVTHNTTEFKRVPGLRVEDWSSAANVSERE
jgi:tRNA(fMet)-specific endonuclease VapC